MCKIRPIGKFGCAISFVIANSVMSLAFGGNTSLASVFIESLIGSVVFMLLPKEVGNIISPVFSNEKNASLGEALRKNVVMRLGFVSKAIFNVKNDVNQVSDRLKELYSPTFDWVCEPTAMNTKKILPKMIFSDLRMCFRQTAGLQKMMWDSFLLRIAAKKAKLQTA